MTDRPVVVVEADLLRALDSLQVSGAVLDVFEDEPLPREHPFVFYPRYAWEVASTQLRLVAMYFQHVRILKRALRDADAYEYVAMAPVREDDFDALELFNATQAAKTVAEKQRRMTAAAAGVPAL